MPYICTTTTKKLSAEEQKSFTDELGRAIALVPGKSEQWLMLGIHDGVKMAFQGTDEGGAAMIEVQLLGHAQRDALDKLTAALTDIASRIFKINPDRVYISYRECDIWGWNGTNL